jgi:hypothetical protein
VRDSAGVRIVEYPAALEATRLISLSAGPVYRYGDGESEHAFARVGTGVLLPDGSAVVTDAIMRSADVLRIRSDGASHSILARSGQGPTEVRGVTSLRVLGPDELLVEDDGNSKLMLFLRDSLERTVSVAGNAELRGLYVLGADDAGGLLMTTGSFRTDFTEPWLPGWMVRLDLESVRPDTVASYDLAAFRPRNQPYSPFQPQGVVTASGGRFVHGRVDLPALTWRAPDGEVEQILRWNPEPEPVTDADVQEVLAFMAADLRRVNPTMAAEDLDRFIADQQEGMVIPAGATLPHFGLIHGDGEGGVWLAEFDPASPGRSSRYHVVGSDGIWLGTVDLPAGFRILDVSGDRVLGVLKDDMDVESVAVFAIHTEPLAG